jgi:hypothetical protein
MVEFPVFTSRCTPLKCKGRPVVDTELFLNEFVHFEFFLAIKTRFVL